MNRDLLKAALIRAFHTFWQTLASLLPVGIVVTPAMLKDLDWSVAYVVLAWLATAFLAALFSFAKSMSAGLPEVQLADTLYALDNESDDDYMTEYEDLDDEEVDEEEE